MKVTNIKGPIQDLRVKYCTPYSSLRKRELILYIKKINNLHTKSNNQNNMTAAMKKYMNMERKTVKELTAMAKECKSSICSPPVSKMKKANMIRYADKHLSGRRGGGYVFLNLQRTPQAPQPTPQSPTQARPTRKPIRSRPTLNNSRNGKKQKLNPPTRKPIRSRSPVQNSKSPKRTKVFQG